MAVAAVRGGLREYCIIDPQPIPQLPFHQNKLKNIAADQILSLPKGIVAARINKLE
jgi:hypothetical protein